MKNDLDLVITALEAEKKFLEKIMKQSISEYDYLIAYYHSEALIEVNSRLRVLHSFKDPFYNEKEQLNRKEKYLKKTPKGISAKIWKSVNESYSKEIGDRKSELEEKQKTGHVFNDSQQLDDLLFAIADGTINNFKIIINLYYDVELLFVRESDTLLINMNSYDTREPDFVFENRSPNPLKGLGFIHDPDKRSWIYRYDLTNFKDAIDIKILLSRLLFDVFNVYDVKQPMIIKYPGI